MPQQLASLKIAVETGNLKKASQELNKLQKAGLKAEKGTDKLTKSSKKLSSSLFTVQNAVIAVASSMVISKVIKYADAMTLVNSKLKLVTDSSAELAFIQGELFAISQKTRTQFSSTVELFERVARSTRDYNIGQKELLGLTETINKAMIISGGTAQSMNAAVVQLGQAFSSDFQAVGQELMSIREQTPRLFQAILEGTGKTSKQFRKLAEEGKLSSKIIIDALKSQSIAVADEFTKMNKTVDQSQTQFTNALMVMIGELDNATNASSLLGDSITSLAGHLEGATKMLHDWNIQVRTMNDIEATAGITTWTEQLTIAQKDLKSLEESQKSWYAGVLNENDKLQEIANKKWQILELEKLILKAREDATDPSLIETGAGEAKSLTDEEIAYKKKTHTNFLNWKFKAFQKDIALEQAEWEIWANERQRIHTKALKKEEKATEKMWDNIGDIAKNNISSALQSGLDGDLDLTAFTSQLSKAVGQAMLMSGDPTKMAMGLGAMAIGSLLGGSDKATKTADEKAEDKFDRFIEGLDKASKALEQFGNIGSAIGGQIESIQKEIIKTKQAEIDYREYVTNLATEQDIADVVLQDWLKQMSDFTASELERYQSKLSSVITSTLADALDISKLSTSQLEKLTAGIDVEAMKAYETELNNIALSMKLGTDTAEDVTRATEILSDAEFAKFKDFSEAFDLLAESTVNATDKVNQAMLGSLSYLSEVEKLSYANNIYQSAITQEDRISSSRTIAELSRGTTRTKEEFVPVFAQYLNELKKQGEEATLTDVVEKLDEVVDSIEEQTATTSDGQIYA